MLLFFFSLVSRFIGKLTPSDPSQGQERTLPSSWHSENWCELLCLIVYLELWCLQLATEPQFNKIEDLVFKRGLHLKEERGEFSFASHVFWSHFGKGVSSVIGSEFKSVPFLFYGQIIIVWSLFRLFLELSEQGTALDTAGEINMYEREFMSLPCLVLRTVDR